MYQKKWGTVSFLCIMALALALAGCTSNKKSEPNAVSPSGSSPSVSASATATAVDVYPENGLPKNEKVILKAGFWEAGGGKGSTENSIKTFMAKFPNVKFDTTFSPDIFKIINTKIAAGNDNDVFDIFSTDGVADVNSLVANKKLEPVEDLWNREVYDTPGKKLKDIVLGGVYDNVVRVNKTSYYIPDAGWAGGLFFDKTLFEKNGWNQNPKTWDEFISLLDTIKASGIIPITFPGVVPTYLEFGFGYKNFELAEMNGNLDKFTADYRVYNTPYFTAPETLEKWNRIYEMGKKGYFPKGVAAINHTQSQMQVMQHKAAMVMTGSWVQNEMKTSTPEGFKWGYMAVPFTKSPDQTVWLTNGVGGGIAGGGFYIWANKPDLNKKWAKEFALWLFTADNQKTTAAQAGSLPIRDLSGDSTGLDSLQDAPREALKYVSKNKVRFESGFKEVILTDPAFALANKTLTDAITEIASGKKDPKPILEQAEKQLATAIAAQKK